MENLKITKGADAWTLPENSWVSDLTGTVRSHYQDRACQHGAVNTGDGKLDKRKIEVTIYVDEETEPRYFSALDFIKGKLYRTDMQLYISESRYINLDALSSYSEETVTGFANRRCFVKAMFICADPLWYSVQQTAVNVDVSTNPQSITLRNMGNIETPFVLTLTADSVAVPEIKLTNTETGAITYYKDPQMAVGSSVVIDSAAGTVKRNGSNSINAFRGVFPTIMPGDNVFTIESAACAFSAAYRPRWL